VPKIVNSWTAAGWSTNVAGVQQGPETALKAPCAVGFSALSLITDDWRSRDGGELVLPPCLQVMLKFANHILRQGKNTRLVKLRLAYQQGAFLRIEVADHQPE